MGFNIPIWVATGVPIYSRDYPVVGRNWSADTIHKRRFWATEAQWTKCGLPLAEAISYELKSDETAFWESVTCERCLRKGGRVE